MSRSRRRTSIIGITTAESEKCYKVAEHRAERHATRTILRLSLDGDDRRLHRTVYGDPWKGDKDGKHYVLPADRHRRDFQK